MKIFLLFPFLFSSLPRRNENFIDYSTSQSFLHAVQVAKFVRDEGEFGRVA